MGCDFSWQVKQKFEEKLADLLESEEKIRKKSTHVQNLLLEYRENYQNNVEVKDLSQDLVKMLLEIQDLAGNVRDKKIADDKNGSLSVSCSSDDIVEPLKKIVNNAVDSKKVSLKSPLKLDTTESILDDPEIVALISKNRNKFMRKVTGS
jgi:tRNA(Met) C34 N-acetyltransferase TmcA